jgi:hypothetical protein
MALGESVNDQGRDSEIILIPNGYPSQSYGQSNTPVSNPPPGTEFFEQGMRLLNIPYEELSVDHIEAMNLIVSIEPKACFYGVYGYLTFISGALLILIE